MRIRHPCEIINTVFAMNIFVGCALVLSLMNVEIVEKCAEFIKGE
jgi:hypothetical protein